MPMAKTDIAAEQFSWVKILQKAVNTFKKIPFKKAIVYKSVFV